MAYMYVFINNVSAFKPMVLKIAVSAKIDQQVIIVYVIIYSTIYAYMYIEANNHDTVFLISYSFVHVWGRVENMLL